MTISEQIREAALYADDSLYEMSYEAWRKAMDFWVYRDKSDWRNVKGRTFLLLVAEALE